VFAPRPAGAGQALELLGSNRSASKKKKIDELRDNLKAEACRNQNWPGSLIAWEIPPSLRAFQGKLNG